MHSAGAALFFSLEGTTTTIHNYIDTEAMILRKGAVSAKAGEQLLIPMNMRDGSLLCTGLGNEEWNCSAPHGAGRMRRREAFDSFTLGEFEKSMEGIYSTSVTRDTLDESPMVYKPMEEIIQGTKDTVVASQILCKHQIAVKNRAKMIWSGRAALPVSLADSISRKRNACQGRRP